LRPRNPRNQDQAHHGRCGAHKFFLYRYDARRQSRYSSMVPARYLCRPWKALSTWRPCFWGKADMAIAPTRTLARNMNRQQFLELMGGPSCPLKDVKSSSDCARAG
jgi:hypothetical protein